MSCAGSVDVFRTSFWCVRTFCRKSADHTHLSYLQRMTLLRTGDYQSSIASFSPSPTRNSTICQQEEGPDSTCSWEKPRYLQRSSLAPLPDPFTLSTAFTYIYAAILIVITPTPSRVQTRLRLRSLVRCVDTRVPRQVDGCGVAQVLNVFLVLIQNTAERHGYGCGMSRQRKKNTINVVMAQSSGNMMGKIRFHGK